MFKVRDTAFPSQKKFSENLIQYEKFRNFKQDLHYLIKSTQSKELNSTRKVSTNIMFSLNSLDSGVRGCSKHIFFSILFDVPLNFWVRP